MKWNISNAILFGASILIIYILGVLSIYIFINSIIFKTDKTNHYDFSKSPRLEEVIIPLPDQKELHAVITRPSSKEKAIVLFLHGVDGNLNDYYSLANNFTSRNISILMVDYRAYGKSKGEVTESSLREDALATMEWLRKRYREDSIIIYAQDFLASVALEISSMIPCRFVILENPVFSLKKWMRDRFPALMLPYELKYDFDTYDNLPKSISPVFIIQSSRSNYCSVKDGKKIQLLLRDPNAMVWIEHSRKESLYEIEKYQQVLDQLFTF